MGQELDCRMRLHGRTVAGKAYLETDHILFRGEERLKIPLKDLRSVKADGGKLILDYAGGPAALELGDAAAKWQQKILHPPSRSDKLGVRSGQTVRVVGDFDREFLDEISMLTPAPEKGKADIVFFLAPARESLDRVPDLASGIQPSGAVWIVYPKGVTAIREAEVIEAGRAAGLKDIKVASFSQSHTALRFVYPLRNR